MLILIFVIFILDRISKQFFLYYLTQKGGMVSIVPPFFNLTLTFNKGAAFGIFSQSTLFLTLFSIIGITILFIFYLKEGKKNKRIKLPTALIIAGALGNLFDRIYYGHVIDFLDFDFPNIAIPFGKIFGKRFSDFVLHRWPAFNIADSSICVGIFLLFMFTIFNINRENHHASNPS